MAKKRKFILFSLLMIPFLLTACGPPKVGSKKSNKTSYIPDDGGMFVSTDKGDTWKQKTAMLSLAGKPKNIGDAMLTIMTMDPSDNKTIYFATKNKGLLYTYDQAETWNAFKNLKGVISDIAIDYNNKCIMYAPVRNQLFKTIDCGRNWKQVYYGNSSKTIIVSVAVDHYNSNNVYMIDSSKAVIKSVDAGVTWKTIYRHSGKISKILICPHDSRIIALATSQGFYLSKDSGVTWLKFSKQLKEFRVGGNVYDLEFAMADKGWVFVVFSGGIMRTKDYGENWEKIKIITPDKKTKINDLAVDPTDSNILYYITDTTFYRSLDGGKEWSTRKVPTTGLTKKILIDPKETDRIYVGVYKQPPKK